MQHLITTFSITPWAIQPAVLALMCGILNRWAAGTRLSAEEIAAAVGDAPEAAAQRRAAAQAASGRGVQVIPVYGVLAHRAYAVAQTSRPLTSTEALASQFRAAVADPEVGTVLMDIDSPGGAVFGVQELADTLAEVKAAGKRLVAVANSTAASGAYWIASQADEIVVTPSGMVGSIGVIVPHTDLSKAYEQAGIKRQYITYGKHKAEGHEAAPLDEEARGYLQQVVDGYGAAFTGAVAKGRRAAGVQVSVDDVRGPRFGEGRMLLARDAVQAGMADRIGTLDETIARYARARQAPAGMRAELADRDIQILEA